LSSPRGQIFTNFENWAVTAPKLDWDKKIGVKP